MKFYLLLLFILSSCTSIPHKSVDRGIAAQEFSAMFSPWEGKEAFDKMYRYMANAQNEVKVTVYSWSDSDFDKALIAAATNHANVKVVLHAPLARKSSVIEKVKKLELMKFAKGKISFKASPRNMHEKFVIIDSQMVVNSSANMSNGAKTSYSENFVFLNGPAHIIENFENEFAVLWNSGKDMLSGPSDTIEDRLAYDPGKHQAPAKDITLYSSSMNFDYLENSTSSSQYQGGQFVRLSSKGGGETPWIVRDRIIKAINSAEKSIYCSFNHFNIREISDALVKASQRGVDVRLTVDNQEFKAYRTDRMIEMTPRFVDDWRAISGNKNKEVPVRVKFYSHYPNPRSWLLNHHKFILIDHTKNNSSDKSLLFTGSYNLSETAEHKQFDNMVVYKGGKYQPLLEAFLGEFERLWFLERKNDQPNSDIVSYYSSVTNDSLPIHHNRAISLAWSEIEKLREQINKMEPGFLKSLNMKTSSCRGYNVQTKKLWGCSGQ